MEPYIPPSQKPKFFQEASINHPLTIMFNFLTKSTDYDILDSSPESQTTEKCHYCLESNGKCVVNYIGLLLNDDNNIVCGIRPDIFTSSLICYQCLKILNCGTIKAYGNAQLHSAFSFSLNEENCKKVQISKISLIFFHANNTKSAKLKYSTLLLNNSLKLSSVDRLDFLILNNIWLDSYSDTKEEDFILNKELKNKFISHNDCLNCLKKKKIYFY